MGAQSRGGFKMWVYWGIGLEKMMSRGRVGMWGFGEWRYFRGVFIWCVATGSGLIWGDGDWCGSEGMGGWLRQDEVLWGLGLFGGWEWVAVFIWGWGSRVCMGLSRG